MKMSRPLRSLLLILSLSVCLPWLDANDEPSAKRSEDAKASAADWYAYYLSRAAGDYQLLWSAEKTPLTLRQQPILNWTNPLEDGQINGSTFVWEHQGRPQAVGQLFSYVVGDTQRSLCHVFSTLSDEPIIARRRGKQFWRPRTADESAWQVASQRPAPAATRAGRLIQMRQLARRIESYTEETTRGRRNLRLLPQPLYRYDDAAAAADGAIFAYVVGNDPELMILVECDLEQPSRWRFRFVQSTRSTTVATWQDSEIYRYDGAKHDPNSAAAVYLSQHGVETIPRELAADGDD